MKAPHDVAREILRGERLDKMKDRQGKPMTDAYLISSNVRKESREVEYIIGEPIPIILN